MTPSTFTWRFKLILKKHGLPLDLNVHSLRHTATSLMISSGADVATVGEARHISHSTTSSMTTRRWPGMIVSQAQAASSRKKGGEQRDSACCSRERI